MMPEAPDNWAERVRMILGSEAPPPPRIPSRVPKDLDNYVSSLNSTVGQKTPVEELASKIESRNEDEEWYETNSRDIPKASAIRLNGILYLRADSGFEIKRVQEIQELDYSSFAQLWKFSVDAVCKVCRNRIIFRVPVREFDLMEFRAKTPMGDPEALAGVIRTYLAQTGCPECGNTEK